VNIAAKIKPVQNIEKLPKGEIFKSSLILIELVFLKVGGFRFVRSIGIKAIENNKEINMKGS
jgi:predicted nucleic-acid-binding protein